MPDEAREVFGRQRATRLDATVQVFESFDERLRVQRQRSHLEHHCGKWVVDLVRHTRDDRAERGELLGVSGLVLLRCVGEAMRSASARAVDEELNLARVERAEAERLIRTARDGFQCIGVRRGDHPERVTRVGLAHTRDGSGSSHSLRRLDGYGDVPGGCALPCEVLDIPYHFGVQHEQDDLLLRHVIIVRLNSTRE